MPETRTFKNPILEESSKFYKGWYIGPDGSRSDGQHFKRDEWDMEVTFTKKVKPPKFQAGDRVNTLEEDGFSTEPGTVVGYDQESVYVVWDINPAVVQTFWSEDDLHLVG